MLRWLRIAGIVIFACLVGFSANSLWQMYETGEWFEQYNNAPKANLTLLIFSIILLGTLGYFEVSRVRRRSRRRGYGESGFYERNAKHRDNHDQASIYATPENEDAWRVRRANNTGRRNQHRSRNEHRHRGENGMIWMRCLQTLSIILPVVYLVILSLNLMQANENVWGAVLLPSVFGILLIFSLVAVIGIFGRKTWGMMLGYVLAVCNLLIFPYGTAVGLVLMMALVGASPVFEVSAASARRQKDRVKSTKRTEYSAM